MKAELSEMSENVRKWSKQSAIRRIRRPTKPKRARALGYRAKQGYAVARVRVKKGRRKRPAPRKGRRPKRMGRFFTPNQSKQSIAEQRAARKFPNMEVLNSYRVARSGTHQFFEILLVDPHHPAVEDQVKNDRGRAFRGRTSAAKKSR